MAESVRRSVLQTLTLSVGLSIVIGVLFTVGDFTVERFTINTLASLLYSLSIGLPATLIFRRLKPRIDGRPVLKQWAIYLGVMLAIILIGTLFSGLVLALVGLVDLSQLWMVYRQGLMISFAISIPVTIGAMTVSRLHTRLYQAEGDRQRALSLATEARLASLESRVRPHFLFNALNSAIALIPEDPRRAEDVLERLCALLRFSLDAQTRLVPLGEEMRVVTDYLEIERVRFGDRLSFTLEVPVDLAAVQVPAFAVQTLVENSVKYGVSARKQGAHIRVTAKRGDRGLVIEVADDGPGFSGEIWVAGHGLDGLRSRLDALYGDRARLVAPAAAESGATVRIEIGEAA